MNTSTERERISVWLPKSLVTELRVKKAQTRRTFESLLTDSLERLLAETSASDTQPKPRKK